jgi:hypothetical protein
VVRLVALIVLLLALSACAANSGTTPPVSGLPPFPVDKEPSEIYQQILGLDTFARSPDITEWEAHVAIGPPPAGGMSWVTYRFNTGGEIPQSISPSWSYLSGMSHGGLWLGIADFTHHRWKLSGPFDMSYGPGVELSPDMVSPLGNVYFAAIVDNPESQYMIAGINFVLGGENLPPVAQIDATPNPAIIGRDTECLLDAGGSSDSDGTIVNYQWDLDGDYKIDVEGPSMTEVTLPLGSTQREWSIYLRTTDNKGGYDSRSIQVSLRTNVPPVAECRLIPETAAVGDAVTLDASGSFDALGDIVNYSWDMDGDGTFEVDGGTIPTQPASMPAQRQKVGLRVIDDAGATDEMHFALSATRVLVDFDNRQAPSSTNRVFDMVSVAGNPALVYQVDTGSTQEMRYVRAIDAQGNQWGAPTTLAEISPGAFPDLEIIGGVPALAYVHSESELRFVAAEDAEGTNWGTPITVAIGDFGYSGRPTLAEVNGTPAIVYKDVSIPSLHLRYVRAMDPQGQSWNPSVGIAGTTTSHRLTVADGRPAVIYANLPYDWYYGDISFTRALDPDGNAWGTALSIGDGDHNIGGIAVMNSLPVVAEDTGYYGSIRFLRGQDADGQGWDTIYSDNSKPPGGVVLSAAVGKPVIGSRSPEAVNYEGQRLSLYLYAASDAGGDNWNAPLFLDTADYYSDLGLTGISSGAGYAFVSNGGIFYDRVDL